MPRKSKKSITAVANLKKRKAETSTNGTEPEQGLKKDSLSSASVSPPEIRFSPRLDSRKLPKLAAVQKNVTNDALEPWVTMNSNTIDPRQASRMDALPSESDPLPKKRCTPRTGTKKPATKSAVVQSATSNKNIVELRALDRVRLVRGNIHQGSPTISSTSRGSMCTACAVVALCVSSHLPPEFWTSETIDRILIAGDQFYNMVLVARRAYAPHTTHPHLTIDEATNERNNSFGIQEFGRVYRCVEQLDVTIYGYVRHEDGLMLPLNVGIARFFELANFGALICDTQTIAIVKHSQNNVIEYCLIDSHARPNFVHMPTDGLSNAFLLRCPSLNYLIDAVLNIHGHQRDETLYTISAIQIESEPIGNHVRNVNNERIFRTYRSTRISTRRTDEHPLPQRPSYSSTYGVSSNLGQMTQQCHHCNALSFNGELITQCCQNGEITISHQRQYPDLYQALLVGDHPNSKEFMSNVRAYNSNMAMASVSANYSSPPGRGPPIIRISGIFHHRIGDVSRSNPRFGSVYICSGDPDTSCDAVELNRGTLSALRDELRRRNPFVKLYRQMGEMIDAYEGAPEERVDRLYINFFLNPTTDRRRFNAPTDPNEIGAVFSSVDGQIPDNTRDLRVYYRNANDPLADSGVKDISRTSSISDPLCYPLLFPNGELGWSVNLERPTTRNKQRKRISMREFYAFRLQRRGGQFNPVLSAGKLTQQFVVDCYVKIEGDRLAFLRNNQKLLRAESYHGLVDYVRRRADNNDTDIGRCVILPSTFQGGHRFMVGNYQDSMTMVAKYGKPSLFITMTCNSGWREIKENIGANQIPSDRPDVTVRVFAQKLKLLMRDLIEGAMFGRVISWVYVIEFQKRGLPHAHISLTIHESQAPKTPEDIDNIVSAELPDIERCPELHKAVLDLMVHGPCGDENPQSPCMVDGKCKKKYPCPIAPRTELFEGSVTYRRREIQSVTVGRKRVDNRWIIPYNPRLLLKYGSHINVLYVASVGCVKYLFKYITKGHDAALYSIQRERNLDPNSVAYDEIGEFVESRYVSACESAWRIYKMSMLDKSHTVVRLPVHLPNEKQVYFNENDDLDVIVERAGQRASLLEAYFRLNSADAFASNLHYVNIPEHYSFVRNEWKKRQRTRINIIGRIYSINPKQVEKFHLRILLLHVKGATSYEDLLDPRDGHPSPCTSFREAARRRLLVGGDDMEWERTLEECGRTQVPGQTRKLLCYLLNYCDVEEPRALFERYKYVLIEDYVVRRRMCEDDAEKMCLARMEGFMNYMNTSLSQYGFEDLLIRHEVRNFLDTVRTGNGGLLIFDEVHVTNPDNDDDATMTRIVDLFQEVQGEINRFNEEQRRAFTTILDAVRSATITRNRSQCFYLQGCGGTGKTYVYNVLLKQLEAEGVACLSVAHTGIAALLLRNGRTAHSAFKLPLDINEQSSSAISKGSPDGNRLMRVKLIVWDEISMTNHHTIDTVDRLLRHLHDMPHVPFGGVCMLLGGDLRQLLPINTHGAAQMEFTFMNCTAWNHFRILELTENMRVEAGAGDYANWLLEVGDGSLRPPAALWGKLPSGSIEIPRQCVSTNVVHDMYGDIFEMSEEDRKQTLSERMILCSLNRTCDTINDNLIDRFPGVSVTSFSVDTLETDDINDRIKYQEEVLNSRDHSGMPKHELRLKVGVPIILLRNISMADGLVNGTRMIVLSVTQFIITAEIVCGTRRGQVHCIPRMDLTSRDPHFPFTLKRRQFPVRACFAMTINKSQGQTFKRVGVFLPQPVFAFGQLYVAFSRTVRYESLRVQIEDTNVQGQLVRGNDRVFTRNLAPIELLKRLRCQQRTSELN